MKHVYLIDSNSRASQYGIGTYIKQMLLLRFHFSNNMCFTIICLNEGRDEVEEEYDIEGKLVKLSLPKVYMDRNEVNTDRYYRNIKYVLSLYIDQSEENIFHFNYLHHFPLMKYLKERYTNCVTILTIHYLNWCLELRGNMVQFKNFLLKKERDKIEERLYKEYISDKFFFEKVDKIICLSKFTRSLLVDYYDVNDRKISVIYNGIIDEGVLLETNERNLKKKELLFPEDEKIILFVARLDVVKGLGFLIKAFKKILQVNQNLRLIIVGDGDYDMYLRECLDIGSKVTFTGKVSRDVLYRYYQIADIGVMPSFHEQCSYVAIEMMMYGIPLIGSNSTGLSEMLNKECCLALHEDENDIVLNVDDLYNCILYLLDDSNNRKSRIYYRKVFEERYVLKNIGNKLWNLYNIC
ncbi:TIGR04157 family glycosyltransferase [Bacteroides hominis]|uniref:TIGR04157 family glycosyltransferase n=1 Tax=Bacteroides hominis TaxID=2763023 RepID=UPI003D6C2A27